MSHLSHSYFSFLSFSKKNIIFSSYKNPDKQKSNIFQSLHSKSQRKIIYRKNTLPCGQKYMCCRFSFFHTDFYHVHLCEQTKKYVPLHTLITDIRPCVV